MTNHYSASAVSRPFWYVEFKTIACLLDQGNSYETIRQKVVEENLFGISKEYRAREVFLGVTRRTKQLDEHGITLFRRSDLATRKLMVLLTILKTDPLFMEFMHSVYGEKIMVSNFTLRESDFNTFFKHIQDISDSAANWTDATLKKLRNSYINYMVEAGVLRRTNETLEITPPLISQALRDYFNYRGWGQMIDILIGVR